MLKKLDKIQIALIIGYIILVFIMLLVPYREVIATGALKHGYKHVINWAVLIYSSRILLNSFGWELFGIEKHLIGIICLELSGVYIKGFIFKENYNLVLSGVIAEVITVALFCGLVFIDKSLYYTGNKKDYEILLDRKGQEE